MRGTGMLVIVAFLVATAVFFVSAESDKLSPSPAGELPEPGITPRNPFYFVDVITENFLLFLYSKPHLNAEVAFRLAKEKLAEVRLLEAHFEQASFSSEQINRRAAEKSQTLYDTYMETAYKSALASEREFIDTSKLTFEYETLDVLLSKGSAEVASPTEALKNASMERLKTELTSAKNSITAFFQEQLQKLKNATARFLKRKTNEAIDDLLNATSS